MQKIINNKHKVSIETSDIQGEKKTLDIRETHPK